VAKRVRGSRSTHRPGGQGPSRTRKTTDGSTTAAEGVSQATTGVEPEAGIETVDAEYTELAVAESAPAPEPKRARRARRRTKSRPDDLAARAAAEDVWVREDLRRIGIVSAVLIGGLAVAWVLFVLLDLLSLY
jgi:hypothetical protein